MNDCRIGGAPASLEAAIAATARLLSAARCPVIAGLATDVAGVEAAAELATRIGGVLDHAASAPLLTDLEALRETGWLTTSPLQARARADLVVLLGTLAAAGLGLAHPPTLGAGQERRIITLGASDSVDQRTAMLGVLRALAAGRPVAADAPGRDMLAACATALQAARYSVIAWSAADLDPLAVHMICGLIDDLNATTRCAGLPVPGQGNAAGVAHALAWRTGFPVRVGFGRGYPEHDTWRFDAARLVASGEADVVLWLGAIQAEPPAWAHTVPLLALAGAGTEFATAPEVSIAVGQPGIDHGSVLFDPRLGALAFSAASTPSGLPQAGAILSRISAAIAAGPA